MTAITALVAGIVLVVLTFVVAVLSAAEGSVRLLGRSRTRRLLEAERRGAEALDSLMERPSRLAAGGAIWRALAYVTATAVLGWAAARLGEGGSEWWVVPAGTAAALIVLFTFGEALPRTLAVHNPERVGLASAPFAARLSAAGAPIARALAAGWVWVVSLVAEDRVGDSWLTGDEYRPESGHVEQTEREEAEEAFLDAVVEFATKIVREVMVPRTDMICLEDTVEIAEAVDVVRSSGCSRLPVFHDTLDDIRGVLYAKDLLVCVGADECPTGVAGLAREPYFVPETKPVDELLVEMRQRKVHMALVADEYGGTAGLVTIEDLLEEIVGEIFDEYDRAEPMVTELEDGSLLLDARVPIDDFNDLLGTAIELEADSIGGLFVELAGKIPVPGESIEVEGVRITAREVEGTRIRRLLVEPRTDDDMEAGDA
jgi:CBS domain containing-hemolysin-like protein